jgi:hypothetical protein
MNRLPNEQHTIESMRMNKTSNYWFPAKRYGWGWGLPNTWQGWAVLIAFFTLLAFGSALFPLASSVVPFLIYSTVLSVILVLICYAKGEPPAWRWGDKR